MLFFFEAAFFVLAILALVLTEIWGRGPVLSIWAVLTAASLLAAPVVKARLTRTAPADRSEANFRRTLVDSWRHLNKLLVVGLAALAAWWLLGSLAQPA